MLSAGGKAEREVTMLTDEGLEFLRERSVFWDTLGPLPPPVPNRREMTRERTFGGFSTDGSVSRELPWRRRHREEAAMQRDVTQVDFHFRSHLTTRQRNRRGESRVQPRPAPDKGVGKREPTKRREGRTMFIGYEDPEVERQRELTRFVNEELDIIDEAFKERQYTDCLHKAEVCLRAVTTLPDDDVKKAETTASLHSCIGNACIALHNYGAALSHHTTALQIGEREKNNVIIARALGHMGRMYIIQRQFNKALQVFARKAPMCSSLEEVTQTFHEIGNCFLVLGHFDYSRDCGRKSLRAARDADLPFFEQQAWILIAISEAKLNHLKESHKAFKGALGVARLKDDKESETAIRGAMDHIGNKIQHLIRKKSVVSQRVFMQTKGRDLPHDDLSDRPTPWRKGHAHRGKKPGAGGGLKAVSEDPTPAPDPDAPPPGPDAGHVHGTRVTAHGLGITQQAGSDDEQDWDLQDDVNAEAVDHHHHNHMPQGEWTEAEVAGRDRWEHEEQGAGLRSLDDYWFSGERASGEGHAEHSAGLAQQEGEGEEESLRLEFQQPLESLHDQPLAEEGGYYPQDERLPQSDRLVRDVTRDDRLMHTERLLREDRLPVTQRGEKRGPANRDPPALSLTERFERDLDRRRFRSEATQGQITIDDSTYRHFARETSFNRASTLRAHQIYGKQSTASRRQSVPSRHGAGSRQVSRQKKKKKESKGAATSWDGNQPRGGHVKAEGDGGQDPDTLIPSKPLPAITPRDQASRSTGHHERDAVEESAYDDPRGTDHRQTNASERTPGTDACDDQHSGVPETGVNAGENVTKDNVQNPGSEPRGTAGQATAGSLLPEVDDRGPNANQGPGNLLPDVSDSGTVTEYEAGNLLPEITQRVIMPSEGSGKLIPEVDSYGTTVSDRNEETGNLPLDDADRGTNAEGTGTGKLLPEIAESGSDTNVETEEPFRDFGDYGRKFFDTNEGAGNLLSDVADFGTITYEGSAVNLRPDSVHDGTTQTKVEEHVASRDESPSTLDREDATNVTGTTEIPQRIIPGNDDNLVVKTASSGAEKDGNATNMEEQSTTPQTTLGGRDREENAQNDTAATEQTATVVNEKTENVTLEADGDAKSTNKDSSIPEGENVTSENVQITNESEFSIEQSGPTESGTQPSNAAAADVSGTDGNNKQSTEQNDQLGEQDSPTSGVEMRTKVDAQEQGYFRRDQSYSREDSKRLAAITESSPELESGGVMDVGEVQQTPDCGQGGQAGTGQQAVLEREQALQERDSGLQERDNGSQERDDGLQERDDGLQEKDNGLQERDQSSKERGLGVQERDNGLQEGDTVLQERDDGLQERDQLSQERDDAVKETGPWSPRDGCREAEGRADREGQRHDDFPSRSQTVASWVEAC